MIPARGPQTKLKEIPGLSHYGDERTCSQVLRAKHLLTYGLPMCVAHMHFSKQRTRSKWSMSAYIAMLCSSGAQCSVAVVTAQSHSSCSKVELNAL